MSSLLNFTDKRGYKIRFETHDGHSYEGTIIGSNNHQIKIINLIQLPGNKVLPGIVCFYKREIHVISKLEEDAEFFNSNLSSDDENEYESNAIPEEPKVKFSDFEYWTNLSNKWSYIIDLNDDFTECITKLNKCDTIAVNAIGHNGRYEEIRLIGLATKLDIFIINITNTGIEAFEKGLEELFESTQITKIVYNSALLYDCLHYIYNMDIINVFDVQVADKCIQKDTKPLRKLSSIYMDYLKMPVEVAESVENFDLASAGTLHRKILDRVIDSVVYLLPLRKILEDTMMNSFQLKNDYCLNRTRHNNNPIAALVSRERIYKELETVGEGELDEAAAGPSHS